MWCEADVERKTDIDLYRSGFIGLELQLICSSIKLICIHTLSTTGGWWHLNWGKRARVNDWSGISGMVSNTSSTWFDVIPFAVFATIPLARFQSLL
jgi:hypothetical protein